MHAAGRTGAQIETALSTLRRNRSTTPSTTQIRAEPGVAYSSRALHVVRGRWLRGTERNAGVIPEQVARRLRNRAFNGFPQFRAAFWRAVADEPTLASQFLPRDVELMRHGFAPVAEEEQYFGDLEAYIIHHRVPLSRGGSLYDMSNMMIVTPRHHQEILDPRRHFGRRDVKGRSNMTRDEAIALIHRLDRVDGSEEEMHAILKMLISTFPHAKIGDLLYHNQPHLTAEQVLDEAVRRENLWTSD